MVRFACVVLVVLVLAAGLGFWYTWGNPPQSQAISWLAGFLVTAVWVGMTALYVRTNEQTLALMKLQWDQQNRVEVSWGLRTHQNRARVWFANLGSPNVMVTEIRITKPNSDSKPLVIHKHHIVSHAKSRGFYLPDRIWKGESLWCDIEIALTYQTASGERQTEAKAFSLDLLAHSDGVYRIQRGFNSLWGVKCPKCGKWPGTYMQTDELHTLQEAQSREKEMREQLAMTCPEHESSWTLTVEKVREANAKGAQQEEV